MKAIDSIDQLNRVLETYFVKGTLTNNYLLSSAYETYIEQGNLYLMEMEGNAGLFVKNELFYRLYFFINNTAEKFQFKLDLPVVMELIYRGEKNAPADSMAFWKKNGFEEHLTRDNMFVLAGQITWSQTLNASIEVKPAHSDEEALYAFDLLKDSLDIYTGDYMTLDEVKQYVKEGNLLVAYQEDKMCGVLQREIKNTGIWLGHIAVDPTFRGMGIAKNLVTAYLQTDETNEKLRYQLWVRQDNKAAYQLYLNFGFKYGGRSTTSMLKMNESNG